MSFLLARTGRQRQRYDNNFRLVSGCIPYRIMTENEDQSPEVENNIEVLMVSSPNRDDLVFPKGGWENDETVEEAACREALEEAGVRGILNENPLGVWEFRSKSSQDLCSVQGGCRGYMFSLEVTEELAYWPEQKNRKRIWLKINEAFELCRYDWMRCALGVFLKVMDEEKKDRTLEDAAGYPSLPIADLAADCQVMSSNFWAQPTSTSHHSLSQLSWEVSL